MSTPKSLLLYQDEPAYGRILKLIIFVVPVMLLTLGMYLWLSGEGDGSLALLVEAFLVVLVFWVVFPRRYQVYEDHMRIVLGGPFAVKIGFDRIAAIEVTSRTAFTVNFATRITKTYVIIVRKHGLSIAITPRSNDLFVDNAMQAFNQWDRTRGIEAPPRTTS